MRYARPRELLFGFVTFLCVGMGMSLIYIFPIIGIPSSIATAIGSGVSGYITYLWVDRGKAIVFPELYRDRDTPQKQDNPDRTVSDSNDQYSTYKSDPDSFRF